VYAKFEVSGIPDDVPIVVQFQDDEGGLIDGIEGVWESGDAKKCINAPLEIKPGLDRVLAVFGAGYQYELQVKNGVRFD
jgi:hypothetical protein